MTSREQKMVLFLPAVSVLALYALFPFRYHMTAMSNATKDAAAAQARAPSAEEMQAKQAQLRTLIAEFNEEAQDLKSIEDRWRAAAGKVGATSRPMRIERLNAMLLKSNLYVIESRDAEQSAAGKSSPALEAVARELSTLAENQQPRRRIVRFRGSYGDAFAALSQLANGDVLAVPLGLTMKTMKNADPSSASREWTLQVWV